MAGTACIRYVLMELRAQGILDAVGRMTVDAYGHILIIRFKEGLTMHASAIRIVYPFMARPAFPHCGKTVTVNVRRGVGPMALRAGWTWQPAPDHLIMDTLPELRELVEVTPFAYLCRCQQKITFSSKPPMRMFRGGKSAMAIGTAQLLVW